MAPTGSPWAALRIHIGESDRLEGRPLADQILSMAREMGLPGATVLRGVAGFGARSVLHTSRILRLSEDLPIVIEIVDARSRLDGLVEVVEVMMDRARCGGLITIHDVEVVRYRGDQRTGTGE